MNTFRFRRTHNLIQVLTAFGTVYQASSMEEAQEWARSNKYTFLTASLKGTTTYKPLKYGRLINL